MNKIATLSKRLYVVVFLLLCVCQSAAANRFKHISTYNGLSSKRTFSIEKDAKGFMWISTRVGIDRYDGKNVKQYSLADETGLADLTGRINVLEKDCFGNLWAYTNYGQVFEYSEASDSYILRIDLLDYFSSEEAPFLINILFADEQHLLLAGSFGIGVYHLTKKTFHYIDEYEQVYISMLDRLDDYRFVVSSDNGACITSFDFERNALVPGSTTDIPINERIRVVFYDKFNASLLIGTATGKLVQYSLATGTVEYLDFDFKTSIRDIEQHNNTLYLATDGAGLVTINSDTRRPEESFVNELLNDLRVASFAYYDMLFDDNRLWIATYSDGVYLIDENLPDFHMIPYRPPFDTGAAGALNTVLEDSDGNLWFATNDGVYRYHEKTGKWNHLLGSYITNSVTRYNALTMCEDDEGWIWVGGSSFGLVSRIHKRTLEVRDNYYFNESPDRSENKHVYALFKDSEGCIWLGGLHGLLTKYDPKNGIVKRYDVISVNTITEHNKIIMVGTVRGLYIFNRATDSFIELLTKDKTQSSMFSFINCIYEDKQGVIWLGSEGGLLRYNKNTDELKVYTKRNGLLSGCVYGILPDTRGRLWLSSDRGLTCFEPQSENFLYFGVEEGLSDDRFSPRSSFMRRNGELLFGTGSGAISFLPEKIDRLNVTGRLVLTNFSVNYQSIHPTTKKSPLVKPIDETDHIRLKYSQNTFSFGFTTINFTNPKRTKFEWQLTGYDKDWIRGTGIENAYYTNVPPGDYEFNLRIVGSDDERELARKNIRITISPVIWATAGAKLIYLLLSVALAWLIIQYAKDRLDKRSASDKIRFFTHTAHELKTPVALIKGPLNKIQENEHLSDDGAVLLDLVVKNTDRLSRLVSQLLDFQKTEMSEVQLVVSEVDLQSYFKERMEAFRELAAQKDIRLLLVFNLPSGVKVWFDEDKMDKIVSNLLSNALKYTPKNGWVSVSVSADKNEWTLEVRDNGIGIPQKMQKEIFKPFYRAGNAVNSTETGSGIGLLLTRNLVKLHHGTIAFESVEKVGTVFTVAFPLGQKHYNAKRTTFVEKDVPDVQAVSRKESSKPTIVIAEDNDELRLFLKQCLVDKYVVHEAVNGVEGVKLTRIIFPELVISDVMMPEMDGYELCRQIKGNKETSHIPIILLTALDDKSNILKGYELGADNYVTKPFDAAIFKLTIENTIFTRQALRRNLMLPLEGEVSNESELATNVLDKAFLDEVMAVIDKNIADSEFSINDLCREMAMSRTSFYNKMKALTNQSPNSFIRLVRLNRAAKLLKEGIYSVSEIACATGFGDVKYFSTAFKKHFGVSPSKYV